MEPDPLLDAPWWVADWLPNIDDERSIGRLRRMVLAVLLAGLLAFVVRGADQPADPFLPPRGDRVDRVAGRAVSRWLLGVALLVGACTSGESANTPAADDRTSGTVPSSDLPVIAPFDQGGVELTTADGTVTCSCVLVADTAEERSQGLMNVTDLQGYAGMVFVFADDVESRFTMRDTPMPLTIGWFGADGSLVSTADMDPCLGGGECPTYSAAGPYRFALEVPQGELARTGATEGSTFRLVDGCEN